MHWIPGHPVASDLIGLLHVGVPAFERWTVATFAEALPLVKDTELADDMRAFIGQESIHAETHDQALRDFMVVNGLNATAMLRQIDYLFSKVLAPSTSDDPKRRRNHLCDRLWLIAAMEHYTAVLGDWALNNAWDDHGAHPAMVDLFRWHGAEEIEHRSVSHNVATYFSDSYWDRFGATLFAVSFLFFSFQTGAWYLLKEDPQVDMTWWQVQRARWHDAKQGLLPCYWKAFGTETLKYLRPGFSPDQVGSTAQAIAYLGISPAARAGGL
jgi:predicted metal-dependent hydrolase